MQALIFNGKAAVYESNAKMPIMQKGESLVRILIGALCNTDREVLKGYKPDFTGVMGHEFVGIVEQSSDESLIGKRVVGELNEGCGHCIYCQTMRTHHCINRKVIGLTNKDGCFAEYMAIATNLLHVVPSNVTDEEAVCCEPLAAALQLAEETHIKPSEEICVIGDGRLSYMIAQALALTGAGITVLGKHPEKLEKFDPFATPVTSTTKTFEIVVDACGHPSGIHTAAQLVRKKGTVLLKSTYAENASINLSQFVVNEVTLKGNRCGPFAPALRLLERNLISLPEITLFSLENWENAFNSNAFKVGFDFR